LWQSQGILPSATVTGIAPRTAEVDEPAEVVSGLDIEVLEVVQEVLNNSEESFSLNNRFFFVRTEMHCTQTKQLHAEKAEEVQTQPAYKRPDTYIWRTW
jgi:hypothetical protein